MNCASKIPEAIEAKVVQLGCGITGLVCAQHLEQNPRVDELVLADTRTGPAKSFADRAADDKITVTKADASDASEVKKLLKDCDLLVSSVSSEMNHVLLQRALAERVNYVDFTIPLETIPKFEEYSQMCNDAGITALTAQGEDPGISDIFAMLGASSLDEVYEVHIRDGDNAISPKHEVFTLWSPRDMLDELTTDAAVYDHGNIKWLPPLSRSELYRFPDPVGSHRVYNTTHEETFLVPMFVKGVRYVDFAIVVPEPLAAFANTIRKTGLHGQKPVAVDGMQIRPLDVVASVMPNPVDMVGQVSGSAGICVEVLGTKDGENRRVRTWTGLTHEDAFAKYGSTATGYLVGTGAAVGVEMVLAREIRRNGLLIPEMLKVDRFVDRMRQKGLRVVQEMTAL